jgi:hypothetical protein
MSLEPSQEKPDGNADAIDPRGKGPKPYLKRWQLPLHLRKLYHDEGLTSGEIADQYDEATPSSVLYWLEKHGIERRDRSRRTARYEMNNYGHMVWRASNGPDGSFPVHRLLAVAEHGTEAVADHVVHHENEIPWDNRAKNLSLVTRAEHARIHAEERISDEELLNDLRAGAAALGIAPTAEDIAAYGDYSPTAYRQHFGSVVEALVEAGIDPRRQQKISSEMEFDDV